MCAAELTWYTLRVYNWILVKHTWWNWHAVPGTAYWNMGHTAGTLRKIGIYFILMNNLHIDVPWNISKIFYWIYFFYSTHGFDFELHDILYSILCKLYILRIDVLYWHIHCARVWYEICTISLFSFGWWYTLMKNKPTFRPEKMANILQITFSNGFSFKINYCLSFCLSHLFHYVPIMLSSWNFQ